jgi:transposase
MPKTRPPYPPQLRARLIALVRSGRSPEELGRQFEPSAQMIRNWLKQADRTTSLRDIVRVSHVSMGRHFHVAVRG